MNQKRLRSSMTQTIDRVMATFESKNAQYAPDGDLDDGDALSAFRRGAAMDGTTMEATLWGFLKKHLVSIGDLALSDDIESIPQSVWQEKVGDMIVYGLFLEAIVSERRPIIDCVKVSTAELSKMSSTINIDGGRISTTPAGESISQDLHTS